MEKRSLKRKNLDKIEIVELTAIESITSIADKAELIDASTSGFKIYIRRKNLTSKNLKSSMDLSPLHGVEVSLNIPLMDLDMTGIIVRSRYIGNELFEVGIDYTSDAPEYWRECLCDMLPAPGEISSK